ncbi:hypothetical protein LTR84_007088 [Exophiala bonariae]|uniref:DUF3533 domain-containing protein n=1 Tax=Exophiala bonariae TaxID=1690606 RepID=A0AAV9N2R8_9EURO|nr:hypothetical protein LTR84_007088 [Exophiala bonariae]
MAQTAVLSREKHVKLKIPVTNSSYVAPETENGNLAHRLWGKWRAHTIMFLTFFAGLATALGHHFMNMSLDKTQVDQAKLSQAWASRFSTSTIPLATVIAPGSLLTQPMPYSSMVSIPVPQASFDSSSYALVGPTGYAFPSNLVFRIAYAAAMSGKPLALPSAYQNQTYDLTFFGPAIKCGSADVSTIAAVSTTLTETNDDRLSVIYVSWVGDNDHGLLDPSTNSPNGWLQSSPWDSYYKAQDQSSSDAARIFVMTNMAGLSGGTRVQVTECLLHNATYNTKFIFQYPEQTIIPTISQYFNTVSQTDLDNMVDMVGNTTSSAIHSYTAIMEAFGKLLVGASIYGSGSGYTAQTVYSTYAYLNVNWNESKNVPGDLERLFQNITLSMLSNDTLIKDHTQGDYISVNATTYPNTFVYRPRDLLIVYGLSLFCTVLCSLIGLHALHINKASYQNIFSTFVRVTGHPELHSLTKLDDTGADPVPKQLAEARIRMRAGNSSERDRS